MTGPEPSTLELMRAALLLVIERLDDLEALAEKPHGRWTLTDTHVAQAAISAAIAFAMVLADPQGVLA